MRRVSKRGTKGASVMATTANWLLQQKEALMVDVGLETVYTDEYFMGKSLLESEYEQLKMWTSARAILRWRR